jgi:hypothetical protein
MPALPKSEIHERIVEALGSDLEYAGDVESVPFVIKCRGLVRVAVYAFTVTDPPGGRDAQELKIQLIAPGQGRGERGTFTPPDEDTFVVLLGYSALHDVFVLWDAYKHQDFAWSKNCQVRLPAITDARLTGLGLQYRELSTGPETIIVARPDHLHSALVKRVHVA